MKDDAKPLKITDVMDLVDSLRKELDETSKGLLMLNMELEQRVDERTIELKNREKQQSSIALLSQKALNEDSLNKLAYNTVEIVKDTLKADYCFLYKTSENKELIYLTTGTSGEDDSKTKALQAINAYNRYVLLSENPVIVKNFSIDTRFKPPTAYVHKDIASSISIIIKRKEITYGILEVLSTNENHFKDSDKDFLTSVANVIAASIVRCKNIENLKYIGLHDCLTGLYNRLYFEEEMQRVENGRYKSCGIIVCDIDGLKLINDSLGHSHGDEILKNVAKTLKGTFRADDVVARIGGDEFVILLKNVSLSIIKAKRLELIQRIFNSNTIKGSIPTNISTGIAFTDDKIKNLQELYKIADDNMYRNKLNHKESSRNGIVQALTKALEERDFITEGHAARLSEYATAIGRKMNLSEERISALKLFSQFHDIGKVGIPDSILFKPSSLTKQEMDEMKKHSEKGYRIAMASIDLIHIADFILKHHEWWNGQGYPLGLNGENIPIECRILAVVDAYDAMSNKRPYRDPLAKEDIIRELKKCSGIQFDPKIVSTFLDILK